MTPPPKLLLIDQTSTIAPALRSLLPDVSINVLAAPLDSPDDLQDRIRAIYPAAILFTPPRIDAAALRTLNAIAAKPVAPVIALALQADASSIASAINAGACACLQLEPQLPLMPIINAAIAQFERLKLLRQQLDKARADLDNRKTIDRAKGLLMTRCNLSEPDAYRALRKIAMDRKRRMVDVARDVIDMAPLLLTPSVELITRGSKSD